LKIFISTIFCIFLAFCVEGQCTYTQNLPIPDEGSTSVSFLVSNAAKNKLGQNNNLCGVSIKFKHEGVGDLDISIISPAGQTIQLIGAGGSIANITDGTLWDINFVSCGGSGANPDPGLSDTWDNALSWGLNQNYTGSYFPFDGCLEDLNIGSVNGTWTILIADADQLDFGEIESLSLTFCDDDLDCTICSPPIANPVLKTLEHCRGTDFLSGELNYTFPVPNTDITNYRYSYVAFGKSKFSGIIGDTSITTFDTGAYKLCLLSYALADSLSLPKEINLFNETQYQNAIQNQGVCANLNGCINLKILSVNDTVVRKYEICEGQIITVNGKSFDKEGSYFITSTAGKCDSLINVVVDKIDLTTTITKSKPIITCVDNSILITANVLENKPLVYKWTTKGGIIDGSTSSSSINAKAKGTYYVEVNYNNCSKIDSIFIDADISIPTIDLEADIINCYNPIIEIKLLSSSNIQSASWTGLPFVQNGLNINVQNPGTYTVTALDDKNCSTTKDILISKNIDLPKLDFDFKNISCKSDSIKIDLIDSSNLKSIVWTGSNVKEPANLMNNFSFPGFYDLVIEGFNGCKDTLYMDLKDERYTINVSVANDTINCLEKNVVLKPNTTFIVDTFLWYFQTTQPIVKKELQTNIPGIYSLVVIDSNYCKGTTTAIVEIDTIKPTLSVSNTQLFCNPDSVLVKPNNLNIDYRYLWFNNTFSTLGDSIYLKIPGDYKLQVTDVNECTNIANFKIIPDVSLPDVAFEVDSFKCTALIAKITPKDTAGLDFNWISNKMINTGKDPFGSVNIPGNYEVEITNRSSGCKRKYIFEMVDLRQYPIFTISADTIGCKADSTRIMFSSNLLYKSATWTSTNFFSIKPQPFVKNVGMYYLSVVDNEGCIFLDSIKINKNISIPSIIATGNTLTCDPLGTKIMAEITDNGPSYTWYFNNTKIDTGAVISVFEPGIYDVIVKNARGCIDTSQATVIADTIKPKLTILPYGNLNCVIKQLSITINGNEPINDFNFSGPGIVSENLNTILLDKPGLYSLIATDQSLCTNEIKFNVNDSSEFINVEPSVTDITCDTLGKVSIKINKTPDSILWDGPANIPINDLSFSTNKSGTFNYKIISKDGCITEGFIELKQDTVTSKVIKTISDTINCTFPIANIGIETDIPFQFLKWDGLLDTKPKIDVNVAKKYAGVITAFNGCKTPFSITVLSDLGVPKFSVKGDTLDCNKGKIDLELKSTETYTSIKWKTPDNKILNGLKVKIDKPGKYFATAILPNGCPKTDSIIIVNNLVVPTISLKDTFLLPCNYSPISLFVSSPDSLVTYRWVGIDKPFVSTLKNPMVDTTLFIRLFTAGSNGCNAVDSTLIILDTKKPKFNFINDTIKCIPAFATLKALEVQDDKSFYWKDPNNKISTTNNLNVNKAGKYFLVVVGQNFCKDSVSLEVMIDTIKPIIDVVQIDSFYCEIKTITLNGTIDKNTPVDYKWSTANGNYVDQSTLRPIIDKGGKYFLTVIDSFSNCKSVDSIDVIYKSKSKINFDLTLVDPLCLDDKNGSLQITNIINAFGKVESQINEELFAPKYEYTLLGEGKYRITIKDSLGCIKDSIINLKKGFSFDLNLPNDEILIELGSKVDLNFVTDPSPLDFNKIEWIINGEDVCSNCENFSIEPEEDVLVKLIFVDEIGCRNSDSIFIGINSIPIIDLPNVISLGGSEENKVYFIPYFPSIALISSLVIYDVWGNIVHKAVNFQPGDSAFGWNGEFNGNKVNPGVFIVKINMELKNGKKKQYVKDLTVLR
jgi:subtilisin-like proprotein convertase family protein